jgi:hypothetical protein
MTKKSDKAHDRTNKELAKLEQRISSVYKEAADEMQGEVTAYFKAFEERDEAQKNLIGTIVNGKEYTESDYQQWRMTQIARGERYEAMRDKLAERYTKANEMAIAYANDDMAKIYALNHAYTIQNVVDSADGALDGIDWTLFDEQTVKRLIKEQPDIMPYYPKAKAVARGIDLDFGKKQITKTVTSGILQGNSVNKIAKDLMDSVTTMNRTSAVRAARTAITEAENAGRQAAAEQLEEKGVILQKRWVATHDSRTREAHLEADGQTVDNDKPFIVGGEELMYPGDKSLGASGWNIYNCRCTRVTDTSNVKFKSILPPSKQGKIKVE